MWYRNGTVTLKKGTNKVLGMGTKWQDKLANVEAGQPLIVNNNIYEITEVKSDTELYIKELALEDVTNSAYVIMSVVYGSLGDVALKASKALAHYQEQMQVFDQMYSGTEPFTVIKPDGTEIEMYPYSLLSVNLQDLNQTIQTVTNYATAAESSANHAQSSASDASQYALNASNSAKQSKDSATKSAESASKSLQSANDSASSASNASQSATQAKQSEDTALSHANNAQSSANDSAQSASESKVSAEEAKQAALNATSGFNKDLLIQEFEALSDEEKQAIKDHLGVEEMSLDGALLAKNDLNDVQDKARALLNLGAMKSNALAHDLTPTLNDVNTLLKAGFYSIASTAKNWANTSSGGAMLVLQHGESTYITQIAVVGEVISFRVLNGTSVWSKWTQVAHENATLNFTKLMTVGGGGLIVKPNMAGQNSQIWFRDTNGQNFGYIGRVAEAGTSKFYDRIVIYNSKNNHDLTLREDNRLTYSKNEVLHTGNAGAFNGVGSSVTRMWDSPMDDDPNYKNCTIAGTTLSWNLAGTYRFVSDVYDYFLGLYVQTWTRIN
ncbi:pyocin knob domain-containing protein [Thorsellia anophelis]|uniref:Uncharacterized protein n=1 Tax=Thorsellia anophelis DSM 18579 TaxID=1123402 RepID=A0A1I0D6B0_9GAMM|nr:pyocin knob domain-containing protein [Thorsellia anophelis]SET27581.1 hypothetical protein SAMN02583745_01860 [Thorsellia anophelis DSM 18579]